MTSTTDNALRRALADARLWLGEDNLHLCEAETLTELLAKIDEALTAPHPQGADDWRARVEADQERIKKLVAALKVAQQWMPLQGQAYSSKDEKEVELVAAALNNLQPPVSVESDQDERVRKHAEKIATLRPPVSVEATGAGRETVGTIEQIIARTNSFQNAASHPECLRQLACINLLATRVLASLSATAPHDQPGSPDKEKLATACKIFNRLVEYFGAEPTETQTQDGITIIESGLTELASLRTTPAPCVSSWKAEGWRPIASAPKDGTWIIGVCNDRVTVYRMSWGRDSNGRLAWCSADHPIYYGDGDGLFAGWCPCPQPGQFPSPDPGKGAEVASGERGPR